MLASLRIPLTPLSDAEWQAVLPHLPNTTTRGRPCDLRAHFNAIFRLAATDGPWRELPRHYGNHDTIARHFRRLTHAGLWERLLIALSSAPADHPLRRLEGLICRAARRAIRIRGLRLITLIRRLNLKRALPAPPWLVADPILSEKLFALPFPALLPVTRRRKARGIAWLRALRRCLGTVAGRRWIPRALKASWP
ncbi:transposase [Roseococcus pinisoli]|uniref:Transposase n=1 Tax=Roseococcus pinisoli TaxID=2835040 RepID=A0ABS5QGC2_9PROT|nr:transposase [Roseococcus pinisoli]MBS7811972.1 transposase [Roseococcus pinisoli]